MGGKVKIKYAGLNKKTVEAFVRVAIDDPGERAEVVRAISSSTNQKDRALRTKEACSLVGVSARTLQLWTRAGHLHPTRATRSHVRYSLRELEKFLGYPLEG